MRVLSPWWGTPRGSSRSTGISHERISPSEKDQGDFGDVCSGRGAPSGTRRKRNVGKRVLKREEIESMPETEFTHPLNPKSGASLRSLSEAAGLRRIGFHMIRLPAGREANEYHTHRFEEEFYYVLEGRGVVLVDGEEHEVGPGAFVGFPAPSGPHLMTNPYDDELVYLVGGERREFEIAEFPRRGKAVIRAGADAWFVSSSDLERFEFS
jgi:uncharacterized cupin superfamily protein